MSPPAASGVHAQLQQHVDWSCAALFEFLVKFAREDEMYLQNVSRQRVALCIAIGRLATLFRCD